MEPSKRFGILNSFKGFGDINYARILFIGMEEALPWRVDEIDRELPKYESGSCKAMKNGIREQREQYSTRFTKIYEIMSKIMVGLSGDDFTDKDKWMNYLFNELMQKKNEVFQANLYPIGKKKVKTRFTSSYLKQFALQDWNHYLKAVREERFPMLKKTWEKMNPRLTICFGKSSYSDFIKCLGLADRPYENDFEVWKKERVLITPFFNYSSIGGHEGIGKIIEESRKFYS